MIGFLSGLGCLPWSLARGERIMAIRTRTGNWADASMGAAAIMLAVILVGCGQPKPAAVASADDVPPPEIGPSVGLDSGMHQPFTEATISEPPEDWHRPPDTTLTGKSVGKLYLEVKNHWEQIRFVSPAGKPLAYWATLDTEMGE